MNGLDCLFILYSSCFSTPFITCSGLHTWLPDQSKSLLVVTFFLMSSSNNEVDKQTMKSRVVPGAIKENLSGC